MSLSHMSLALLYDYISQQKGIEDSRIIISYSMFTTQLLEQNKRNQNNNIKSMVIVKIKEYGLGFFFIFFLILFFFQFILHFSIFRTLGLGLEVIGHTITPVTSDGVVTTLITGLERKKQKVLEQSDVIQHGHYMLTLCFTHDYLGQDAQQLVQTIYTSI